MKATFAAGCFWGVEAYFKLIEGVIDTEVGYAGGDKENPTYEEVCTGKTGHAEACEVEYDDSKITFEELLHHFFKIHDPTSLNKQGGDVGTQYRSVIFYHDESQKDVALKTIEELNASEKYKKKIVAEVISVEKFYKAEDYHQDYLDKNPSGYCHVDLTSVKKTKMDPG